MPFFSIPQTMANIPATDTAISKAIGLHGDVNDVRTSFNKKRLFPAVHR